MIGIVVVSHNTCDLIGQLIYSLYRRIRRARFHLVVVDNASIDGSVALLRGLRDAGLADVIFNDEQRYHGPGLNQGLSHLAHRQETVLEAERIRYVWILDSDCVVARDDTLSSALDVLQTCQADIVGQVGYDQWYRRELIALNSMLLDPFLICQPRIAPFQEDGNPSAALQESAALAGIVVADFPFTRNGYVIHLGRSTLRAVVEREDRSNRYYEWARDHHKPHFAGNASAWAEYQTFLAEFRSEVGELTATSLSQACIRYR